MKFTKATFSKSFELKNGDWEKISLEIELEGDSPEKALKSAKNVIESFFVNSNEAENIKSSFKTFEEQIEEQKNATKK